MHGQKVILFLFAWAAFARADVVHLKNGNDLEGLIRAETDQAYQVDLGVGTVTVSKGQVAGVERATATQRTQLEEEWRRKFSLAEKFVPAGQRDLLDALRALEAQRDGAHQARQRLAGLQQALAGEAQSLRELQAAEATAASQLTPPVRQTHEALTNYNRKVAEVNELRGRIFGLQQKPAEQLAAMDDCRRAIALYTGALLRYAERVKQRKQQDTTRANDDFFAAMETRLATYLGEIKQTPLPAQGDKRQVVVKARLNGQVEGSFVVDTGASCLCISEALAQRLHLTLNPAETQVTLADGSTRKARATLLRSVEVAGARVENVAALAMPGNPGEGLDGLLGMSFLMEFNLQLDPVSHTLILNRFAPP